MRIASAPAAAAPQRDQPAAVTRRRYGARTSACFPLCSTAEAERERRGLDVRVPRSPRRGAASGSPRRALLSFIAPSAAAAIDARGQRRARRRRVERRRARLRLLDLARATPTAYALSHVPSGPRTSGYFARSGPASAAVAARDQDEHALGERRAASRCRCRARSSESASASSRRALVAREAREAERAQRAVLAPLPLRGDRVGRRRAPLVERRVHRDEIAPRRLVVRHVDELLRRDERARRRARRARARCAREERELLRAPAGPPRARAPRPSTSRRS